MTNIESHPEGFNALRRMYETVQVCYLATINLAILCTWCPGLALRFARGRWGCIAESWIQGLTKSEGQTFVVAANHAGAADECDK